MPSNKPLVLVAEDSAIIGDALIDNLEEVGFAVAGPFDRHCDAEEWLQSAQPDCAVLDARLKDGDCTALAAELVRRNIPVVVFSGFQRQACPVQIPATVWLEKPASLEALAAAIRAVTAKAS
ncbi:response regulator [Alsobacter sp. SYSU BS001988]